MLQPDVYSTVIFKENVDTMRIKVDLVERCAEAERASK